jgi:hypothetical protein
MAVMAGDLQLEAGDATTRASIVRSKRRGRWRGAFQQNMIEDGVSPSQRVVFVAFRRAKVTQTSPGTSAPNAIR